MSRSAFRRTGALPALALAVLLVAGGVSRADSVARPPYEEASTSLQCGNALLKDVLGPLYPQQIEDCIVSADADAQHGSLAASVDVGPVVSTGQASGTVTGIYRLREETQDLAFLFTFLVDEAATQVSGVTGLGAEVVLRARADNMAEDCTGSNQQQQVVSVGPSLLGPEQETVKDLEVTIAVFVNCFDGGPARTGEYRLDGTVEASATAVGVGSARAVASGRLVRVTPTVLHPPAP